MEKKNDKDTCATNELDLFSDDVSSEALESYMNDNFQPEAQASLIALLAATFL
jgi:hypothetical protein